MTTDLLVRGKWIITGGDDNDRVLSDAAIRVRGDGIAEIGDWQTLRAGHPEAALLGGDNVALLPGLINAHHHSHGVTNLQQGIADDLLELWLIELARCRRCDVYLETILSAARLLRSGVTTVVDVFSGGGRATDYAERMNRALAAYDKAGMRVAFAAGFSDQSHLVHDGGSRENERFLANLPADARKLAQAALPGADGIDADAYFAIMDDAWRRYRDHPRIDLWFGPPGPQWVSKRFMERIADQAAAYDTNIQTHVAESFYEKLMGPRFFDGPILSYLRDIGVLSPRFSIAHGVWLSEPEIALLAETGAAVSHNPSSNLRLRAGIAPLNAMLAAGATVALGMDGTTLGDDDDMFAEMRLAMRLQRTPRLNAPAPLPRQVLAMATSGGAKLMRRENVLGRLAPGFAADVVLLDLERLTWPWVAPEADPRDLILMRAQARDVRTVLVGGEIVLRDGLPTRFDLAAAGREIAAALAAQPAPDARLAAALKPHINAHYAAWPLPALDPYIPYNSRR